VFYAAAEAQLGLAREAAIDLAEARDYFHALGDRGLEACAQVLAGILELTAGGPAAADAARARLERARAQERQADIRSSELLVALRLLETALHTAVTGAPVPLSPPPAAAENPALEIGPEGRWFRRAGAGPVELTRRAALRLMLEALVAHRLHAAGVGLPPGHLFEAGWPGQRALPAAASGRVYTAVRTLRRLGLEGLLLRQDDGYLLDPAVPVVRVTLPR
jgi:hypothetical protein